MYSRGALKRILSCFPGMVLEEQEAGRRMIDVRYCSPAVQVERKARDQNREIPELNTNTNTQYKYSIRTLNINT